MTERRIELFGGPADGKKLTITRTPIRWIDGKESANTIQYVRTGLKRDDGTEVWVQRKEEQDA